MTNFVNSESHQYDHDDYGPSYTPFNFMIYHYIAIKISSLRLAAFVSIN